MKQRFVKSRPDPYAYCMSLEEALLNLCGQKSQWYGMAGSFQNPTSVRRSVRAACNQIRRRLREIVTVDDRLALLVQTDLEAIERAVGGLGKKSGAEIHTIAELINLTAHLLGYDWLEGQPNRQVMYFQTKEQQQKDDRERHPTSPEKFREEVLTPRQEFICNLHARGLRVAHIAEIMNQSETVVKDILVRSGKISRGTNTKNT